MQRSPHPILKKLALAGTAALISVSAMGFTPSGNAVGKGLGQKLTQKFSFKNWGLINERTNSHISAPAAWKIEEGNSSVVVAVIDTGIDPTHSDLAKNIWHEKKNGVPDGVYGWNFVIDRPNPLDDHGHGTHVAGIIGAVANPLTGVSGVAHRVSIMPVKYYSDSNSGIVNLRNTIRALHYAIDHGAKIINYSGGGPERSEEEYLAMKKAEAHGVLVVAAAGNEHQDTDQPKNYYFPAAYRLSNIISVAATDIQNSLLPSSNWGRTRVDVAAPGENIYSTLPGGRYGYMSGTSQATAFVTGMAALLLAKDPKLTPMQLREIIMSSVDRVPQLSNRVATGGKVNAYAALLALSNNPQQFRADILTRFLATTE
jgi:subtilisin family serine protease